MTTNFTKKAEFEATVHITIKNDESVSKFVVLELVTPRVKKNFKLGLQLRQGSILVRPLRQVQEQVPSRLELVQEEPLHLEQVLHHPAAVSFF